MVEGTHPLNLTCEQGTRLRTYIQAYRQYAFNTMLPTVARNTNLRLTQTVYAKLLESTTQMGPSICLWLTHEEVTALKEAITELHAWHVQQKQTTERSLTIADLVGLIQRLGEHG
jgi:hypothetical protein